MERHTAKIKTYNNSIPEAQKDWEELLHQALGYEQLGMTDINGHLNGIADLFDSMKEQLADAT
ncbi:MAG: hypothetical protein IPJ02_17945 [Chitinophagaceae bacterium]|nr:hypothetical protein [Chitinophagaceae bacterium]